MAFINNNGEKISFLCDELIEELTQDIVEFGGDTIVSVWCKDIDGTTIYTNYDFIEPNSPLKENEIKDPEHIKLMSMSALLSLLETQNEIL